MEKAAGRFRKSRQQDHDAVAEDYTELIADLIESTGEARTCEIAEHMGISHVTAIRTLRRLEREGFVQKCKYRPVELTERGRTLAAFSKARHQALLDFFIRYLGVSPTVAFEDVEGVEHHISQETLACMQRLMGGS